MWRATVARRHRLRIPPDVLDVPEDGVLHLVAVLLDEWTVLGEEHDGTPHLEDLARVTAGRTNEALARMTLAESKRVRPWMRRHGVHFQPSLGGTLHLSRTNAFFLGGGKALLNAYYRSAASLGIAARFTCSTGAG